MTLVQFQVFLAVIEEKSFTKAAEKLNMTQSAVSQTISALENELGVSLLVRSRNGVSLTYIGERMQTHARDILHSVRCMTEEANAARGLDVGNLRIGCIPSMAANLLPGIIRSFHAKYPNVKLVLFEGSHQEIREWIANTVVDVGFISIRADEGVTNVPLLEDRLHAYVPRDHRLAGYSTVVASDLENDPFIASISDEDGLLQRAFRNAGISPNVSYQVREIPTILAMVNEGIGVTILSGLDHSPLSARDVVKIPLDPPVIRRIGLGVLNMEKISPIVAEFILHSKAHVQSTTGIANIP